MMGRLDGDQGKLFYAFDLDAAVPADHLVREIDRVLDLSWVRLELVAYYSRTGRRSIDPVLLIRMLVLSYVFAIRSERALCREVGVNLAYRWFCGLGIEDRIPDHSAFTRARNERFRDGMSSRASSSGSSRRAWLRASSVARASPSMRASSRPMPTSGLPPRKWRAFLIE